MKQKSVHPESPSERIVKNIRRATRKRHSSEEKIRIVLDGLRGESSIAELCRREGIAEGLYYAWSKEFLEAGKRQISALHHFGRKRGAADKQRPSARYSSVAIDPSRTFGARSNDLGLTAGGVRLW